MTRKLVRGDVIYLIDLDGEITQFTVGRPKVCSIWMETGNAWRTYEEARNESDFRKACALVNKRMRAIGAK